MRRRLREAGTSAMAMLVIVIVCGGIAAAVVLPGLADSREANASLTREQAFQLAESGIDWGIAVVRRSNGAMPSETTATESVAGAGRFVLTYTSGASNSIDDDGDGSTDEADELDYIYLRSTGYAGDLTRTLEVILRKSVQVPTVDAALQFNVETPILDLKGNAFAIDGNDHDLDGVTDASTAAKAGIASPAVTGDILAQIPVMQQDQVLGNDGPPSIAQVPAFDLDALAEQARAAASIRIEGGTHTDLALGEPTESGVVVAYSDESIHLSGSSEGAGILVVDGDLKISGSFTWRGLIIVRGRVIMVGGGSTKRVIGGILIGEELTNNTTDGSDVTVGGTVDLLYSGKAIQLATASLVIMSVLSWEEVGSP